jgi:hypothetical protein
MIFITTNYYFEEEEEEETKEINICFICFENENESKYILTKLKNQKLFIKNCVCDGWIHNECLTKWCNFKQICPICRKFMVEIVNLPSCNNNYLDHFLFFVEYYVINNHNSNNIFIIMTKSGFLFLCMSFVMYSIYYYTIYYLLFFLLFFVFSTFYFILFVIFTWSYRVTRLEPSYDN